MVGKILQRTRPTDTFPLCGHLTFEMQADVFQFKAHALTRELGCEVARGGTHTFRMQRT